jgi:ABC-type multidrug transport system ATPase subunit
MQASSVWDESVWGEMRESRAHEFRWSGLTVCTTDANERILLDNVSGCVRSGEMLSLMGSSGSGKTTLVKRLADAGQHDEASCITLDGIPFTKSMRHRMAYVAQDDVLFLNLTVRQTLTHASILRRPVHRSSAEQEAALGELLLLLRLVSCLDVLVLCLSGGQKRRVSIAIELLSDPMWLLADEPTSGLDSIATAELIQAFRALADRGTGIICTIHQPSSQVFELFDKLLLLAPGGHTVYYGHRSRVTTHMGALGYQCPPFYNAAEHILSVIQHDAATLITAWHTHGQAVLNEEVRQHQAQDHLPPPPSPSPLFLVLVPPSPSPHTNTWSSTWSEQFWVLLQRAFQQKRGELISHHQTTRIMAVSLIASLIWFQLPITARHAQDRFGSLFFVVSFWLGGTLSCALASACFVSPFHPASYAARLLEHP